MKFKRALFTLFLLVVVTAPLQGCVVVSTLIQAFRDSGFTPADRRALLGDRLKAFHDHLGQNRLKVAFQYVDSENFQELSKKLRKESQTTPRVAWQLLDQKFNDYSTEVDVLIASKRHNIARSVLENSTEREHWTFSATSGWLLVSSEPVADTDVEL